MVKSQYLALCGDGWKFREDLPGDDLFLENFMNGEGANKSLPFFVGEAYGKKQMQADVSFEIEK
jgi:hypothetical protein